MSLSNSRAAFVSLSTARIPVYDGWKQSSVHVGGTTPGGNVVAEILKDEFYTLIPNPTANLTSYTIIIQNPSKQIIRGNIETSPGYTLPNHAWVAQQHPYHFYNSNGTTLVASATEVIGGVTHRIFTVHGSARNYRDSGGTIRGTIPVGAKLAARDSTTGVTYGDHMLFYKKKIGTGAWQDVVSGGSSTYGFVDLGMAVGAFPASRQIR
jgi:hypothetical protein